MASAFLSDSNFVMCFEKGVQGALRELGTGFSDGCEPLCECSVDVEPGSLQKS